MGESERDTRTWVLAAANLVMVALLVAGSIGSRTERRETRLLDLEPGSVTSFSLTATSTLAFERRADGWEIVDGEKRYPARSDRIEPFLAELAEARVTRFVTGRPGRHAELGVAEEQSDRIDLTAGTARVGVFVGEERDGELLVRRVGSDDVVATRARIGFYLDQTESFWAYLRLFPESARPTELVRASIMLPGEPALVASRTGPDATEWRIERGGAPAVDDSLPAARLDELARDLVDLVGVQFYHGSVESLPIVARISFGLADGRTFAVTVSTDGESLVAVPDGPDLPGARFGGIAYTIAEERLRRLVSPATEVSAGP